MNKTVKKYLVIYLILFPIIAMQFLGYSETLKNYMGIRCLLIFFGSSIAGVFITFGIFWLQDKI